MSGSDRRIWSPWRSEHMERFVDRHRPVDDLSRLFETIGQSTDDEEHLVVWRGEKVFVLMNLFPYNNGHLLVAPYRRVERLQELDVDERSELVETISRCTEWLEEVLSPDGFNVGMNLGRAGGAGIPGHLHAHVVPRWAGDTNFMSTTADLRVIPESIRDTYVKIRRVAANR